MVIIDWIKALYECDMRGLAGFIWLGIIALGVIFTAGSGGNLKVAKWSVISIVSFYILAKLICGPSLIDTYRMKPMGEAINSYLVSKGKPTSLNSIPDLPYKLKCSKPYSCSFEKGGRVYQVWLEEQVGSYYLELYIAKSKTGILYTYDEFNEKKFVLRKPTDRYPSPHIYSSKTSGICNPMRQ